MPSISVNLMAQGFFLPARKCKRARARMSLKSLSLEIQILVAGLIKIVSADSILRIQVTQFRLNLGRNRFIAFLQSFGFTSIMDKRITVIGYSYMHLA